MAYIPFVVGDVLYSVSGEGPFIVLDVNEDCSGNTYFFIADKRAYDAGDELWYGNSAYEYFPEDYIKRDFVEVVNA